MVLAVQRGQGGGSDREGRSRQFRRQGRNRRHESVDMSGGVPPKLIGGLGTFVVKAFNTEGNEHFYKH